MSAREELAARQAQLLRALLAGAEPPDGFPPHRLATEARSLRNKRRKLTARLEPELVTELGERFGALFDAYALANPPEVGAGARADAARFVGWLSGRGELPRARGLSSWLPLRRRGPR